MATIPENEVTQQDLNTWYEMQDQLSKLKAAEILLRNKIFKGYFKEPVEGTNTHPLADGWVLKAVYPITRKPDIALLTSLSPELRAAKIPVDSLISYKPELVTGEYRKLTAEEAKSFDRILEVKPGSPQMEIVKPKRAPK